MRCVVQNRHFKPSVEARIQTAFFFLEEKNTMPRTTKKNVLVSENQTEQEKETVVQPELTAEEPKNEIAILPIESLNFVADMKIGTLTTNARVIRDSIKALTDNFSIEEYIGNPKKAADRKAKLNTLAKQMNDARIAYEKEWMQPFNGFKDLVSESVNLVKSCTIQLDGVVKEEERREKEAKRAEIVDIWKVYDFNLVPLERIFNDKWLNKSYKTKQIHDDIAHIIDRITGDLQSLEQFGEDTATLKELYLTTLDLQATLRRGAELRENRKRLQAEEERKAQLKAERQTALMQRANEPEQPQTVATTANTEAPTYNVNFNTHEVTQVQPEEPKQPVEKLFDFYVTMPIATLAKQCGIASEPILMRATMQQMKDFRSAMESNGFVYEKSSYKGYLLLDVHVKGSK